VLQFARQRRELQDRGGGLLGALPGLLGELKDPANAARDIAG
jgi:hypothetical protein